MLFYPDHTFIIAEVGINHNGDVEIAKQLIDAAAQAGCDAVKFQMRTPELSLPKELWHVQRDTPWGVVMSYIDYRKRIELNPLEYSEIVTHCKKRNILFGASPWDIPALYRLNALDPAFVKVASASLTNLPLVQEIALTSNTVVMSTGMSTADEISTAWKILRRVSELGMLVCTSAYPCKPEDLHLSRIDTLIEQYGDCATIGYSGHEPGLWTTLCAVVLGARIVERHITLDRSMKGSDHGASVEPPGLKMLVREIRNYETALGSGELKVHECELKEIARLRGAK